MTDWPILSTVTFLPLVGVLLILLIRDDSESARRNIRDIALLTTVFTFVLSLFIWIGFDNAQAGFQMVEKARLAGFRHLLPHGRRRHLDAVRHPDDLPDAVLHPGVAGNRSRSASRNT